jgi:hypothetical protein
VMSKDAEGDGREQGEKGKSRGKKGICGHRAK